jgi:hypothetical protein
MQFLFAPTLTPALSHGERETYGDVLQSRFAQTLILAFSQWEREEEREAIRRLNPAIPGEVSCLRGYPVRGRRFCARQIPADSLPMSLPRLWALLR